ncbi:hypothetical protein CHELA40_40115 [Chelatococcus asaccharovorans]|nr:hypothetical protein CHELA17_50079 [Chelatococcus asaccharovorans]CAH1689849.1 hypothetical protein CHELA40_40115 [Chelatococcus asaccharovorans]
MHQQRRRVVLAQTTHNIARHLSYHDWQPLTAGEAYCRLTEASLHHGDSTRAAGEGATGAANVVSQLKEHSPEALRCIRGPVWFRHLHV